MSDIPIPAVGARAPANTPASVSVETVRASLVALLAASFAVIVLGVFRHTIDGDEYIFLSIIHRVANGERVGFLQTAYVHLLSWMTWMEHDEIVQVTIGRLIYVALWGGSLTLLYRLARRLLDPLGALASVVMFAIFFYCVATAVDFRIDGLLLPVLLSVALLLLNPTIGRVAAAGALSGLAVALSIKAVLWAPAFIGVLAVGLWGRQDRLRPILAGAFAGTATLAAIMLVHSRLISMDVTDIPATVGQGSSVAGGYMLLNGLVPRWDFLKLAVVTSSGTWILLAIGTWLALAGLRQARSRRNSLLLLLLALPILSVIFYTNAFPYAYVVLMPTACLLAGHAFSTFATSGERPKRIVALGCLGIAAIPMVPLAWEYRNDGQERQKRIVTEVHRLFPEPVAYIDISGLVASFPRRMVNITRFGLDHYGRAGVPAVANYIYTDKPPLLIVNTKVLQVWDEEQLASLEWRLLPQDEEAIRATYAHYWDQIWLAGRQWRDLAAGESRSFEIVVPGDHTLIANGPVTVDGETYEPWTTVGLDEGPHELFTTSAEPDLRILWGTRLMPPEDLPPSLAGAEE